VNEELATAPEKVNTDAHGSWMIKIELKDRKKPMSAFCRRLRGSM